MPSKNNGRWMEQRVFENGLEKNGNKAKTQPEMEIVTGKNADKRGRLHRLWGVQQKLIHENTEGGETQ